MISIIVYYILIIAGYMWSLVEIMSGRIFDGLLLFGVTWAFNTYRNEIKKQWHYRPYDQDDDDIV